MKFYFQISYKKSVSPLQKEVLPRSAQRTQRLLEESSLYWSILCRLVIFKAQRSPRLRLFAVKSSVTPLQKEVLPRSAQRTQRLFEESSLYWSILCRFVIFKAQRSPRSPRLRLFAVKSQITQNC